MSIHDLLIKPNYRDIAQAFVNNDNHKRIFGNFYYNFPVQWKSVLSPLLFRSDRRPCIFVYCVGLRNAQYNIKISGVSHWPGNQTSMAWYWASDHSLSSTGLLGTVLVGLV